VVGQKIQGDCVKRLRGGDSVMLTRGDAENESSGQNDQGLITYKPLLIDAATTAFE
jgi:hypothetical protein